MKQIKVKGLNIVINDKKNMGYSMANEAQKEFCQYHRITYAESNNGAVTTKRAAIHSLMFSEFSKVAISNNWRKMHGLPLIRRRGK